MNDSIKLGVYAGLFLIIYNMVIYLIDPKLMFGMFGLVSLAVTLAAVIVPMVLAAKQKRTELGDYIDFKGAFRETLQALIPIALIMTVFGFLLYQVIDPGLNDLAKEAAFESIEKWADRMPEESYEKQIARIENMGPVWTPKKALIGLAGWLAVGSIIGAIVSAVIKRPKPLHVVEAETQSTQADEEITS